MNSNNDVSSPSSAGAPAQPAGKAGDAAHPDQTNSDPQTPIAEAAEQVILTEVGTPDAATPTVTQRVKALLIGKPRDLHDQSVFHAVSLIAFLAWVGLGADGLSSSCYGPAEAFANLRVHDSAGNLIGDFTYLAVFLSLATILTVVVISTCYSHIIEEFPSGGGGYLVASKCLGRPAGVISGSALLVDYILTITVSIAAAGDALFGLVPLPQGWAAADLVTYKLWCEAGAIGLLILLNLRGVKESVTFLTPIFLVFLGTHVLLIFGSIGLHFSAAGEVARDVSAKVQEGLGDPNVGLWAMLAVLLNAYSLGAGTYTGIEAVSNSMPVMREPKVATAQRTMTYMACSLAFTAGGLMVAYLLLHIHPPGEGASKTMNQVLSEQFVVDTGLTQIHLGSLFVWITIISEGALLFVAAQAGFIDGPRVLANMAQDSYMPHWFANLSERLSTHNGVTLIGGAALAALLYSRGEVSLLLVMYSINVFVTFSLSMVGMCLHWWGLRKENRLWLKRLALFAFGALMCLTILCVTVYVKIWKGGWVTIAVTGLCVGVCFATRWYYETVMVKVRKLDQALLNISVPDEMNTSEPNPSAPTAAVLVGGYGGLGIHTMMNALKFVPGHFKNLVFVSVGVVDSGNFKGAQAIEELEQHTRETLERYVDLANRFGFPATSFLSLGADAVEELEQLCLMIAKRYPRVVIFAGQLLFHRDTWYQRLFHNQTAFALQRRLHWDGVPMVILPTRVR